MAACFLKAVLEQSRVFAEDGEYLQPDPRIHAQGIRDGRDGVERVGVFLFERNRSGRSRDGSTPVVCLCVVYLMLPLSGTMDTTSS